VVTRDDPRVTGAGRVLRRTSLDEIPNLLNVLRGEMAIVGPRPTIPAQVVSYTPRQSRRHEVRPGITGWAQIRGRAGIPWEERIELDLWYVENRSAALDLRILLKTAWLLVTGHGLAPD
jgi:lipopolysaccharide/colanic/teichoic acid biosynthesis glycosyltransferase